MLGGDGEKGISGETYDAVEGVEHIKSMFFGLLEMDMLERGFEERKGGTCIEMTYPAMYPPLLGS